MAENGRYNVAIVGGYGKMGRWFARQLKQDGHRVTICGRDLAQAEQAGKELGVSASTCEEAVRQSDAVILSVTMDAFESAVRQIAPHTRRGQYVLDVTSIKVRPVEVMHAHVKEAAVMGTHPMFGPGAGGIDGQRVVLTPVGREEEELAAKLQSNLQSRGARVSVMSPERHDRLMSIVLGLSHFAGLVAADTLGSLEDFKEAKEVGGPTFRRLLELAQSVVSEDPDFYSALQMNLPDAAEIESVYSEKARAWQRIVSNKDRQQFIRKMTELKGAIGP
jgi:prephenate dehydrogenase